MRLSPLVLLSAYSGLLTVGLVAVAVLALGPRTATLRELDVQRINVREPDGRLRLVISDRGRFPGVILHGHEHALDRQAAGLIFFDDEATEDGGLIFSGAKDAAGRVSTVGHLSFDQYDQDQVVNLQQTEDGGARAAGLTISDRPDAPIDIERGAALRADPARLAGAVARGDFGRTRAFFGKSADRSSELTLRDAGGAPRLRLRVTADGRAQIAFLNERGEVTRVIEP
jgi:hypothetical protein